jgi:hypothetical protein
VRGDNKELKIRQREASYFFLYLVHHYGDQVKQDEVLGREKCLQNLVGKPEGKSPLEKPGHRG